MILTIARREWQGAFLSPLAWLLLAAHQLILGWMLLRVVDAFASWEEAQRSAGLSLELALNLYGVAAVLALFSAPLLAVRALTQEFRDGTFELFGAAPVTLGQVLLGKFLGLVGLGTVTSLLPLLLALLLLPMIPLDLGLLGAATLGLWLTTLLFAAMALFGATLSQQPGAAAVAGYGLLLLFSVLNRSWERPDAVLGLFEWLSWNEHLFWFLVGVVRVSDVAYLLLFGTLFLALAHRRLINRRRV